MHVVHRARWLTGFVPLVVAVTAIAGGSLLVARPDGALLGTSPALLAHSPFATFWLPGLILAVVVGGTNAVAAALTLAGARRADAAAMVAGAVLGGWVIGEMLLLRTIVFLQVGYLVAAIATIVVAVRCRRADLVHAARR